MTRIADDPALRYTRACREAAATVIRNYSTSFGLASRMLSPRTRPHVVAIYALARLGDEIVDGAFGTHRGRPGDLLDALHSETLEAIGCGYSTNPIVHAFADTARQHGIGAAQVDPFFASMRMDLEITEHDADSLARYIHGSAEVIGEMCLRCFDGGSVADDPEMTRGAHALGAAFQKVNFLRDLREDHVELGRNYLPGRDPARLSEVDLHELTEDIDRDLRTARRSIDRIPGRDRRAVWAAHDLFAELNTRLKAAGADRVRATRVRVPDAVKLRIAIRAAVTRQPTTGEPPNGSGVR